MFYKNKYKNTCKNEISNENILYEKKKFVNSIENLLFALLNWKLKFDLVI